MAEETRKPWRPLLPEQIEEIGRRRLRGESHRSIADDMGISPTTSVKHWKTWLANRSAEFQQELDAKRAELISRLFRIADDAAAKGDRTDDERAAATWAQVEMKALADATKLLGLEAAQKVEHSGEVGFTVLELTEEVDETPVGE